MFFDERMCHVIDNTSVPIHATKLEVTSGRNRRVVFPVDLHESHIKRSAPEIINENGFLLVAFTLIG